MKSFELKWGTIPEEVSTKKKYIRDTRDTVYNINIYIDCFTTSICNSFER